MRLIHSTAVILIVLSLDLAISDEPSKSFLVENTLTNERCSSSTTCVPLTTNATCFGTILPYQSVSFSFTGLQHVWNVKDRLLEWEALKAVPKCWAVIQPLLCAVYMPKCEDGHVDKVPHQLCRVIKNPCRIVENTHEWPSFLRCDNESVYTPVTNECQENEGNEPRRILRFNTTGTCLEPYLLRTTEPLGYYGDVDECGISCRDPRFSDVEHHTMHGLVKVIFSISLTLNLIAVATLIARWPKSSRGSANLVPNRVICYMNCCYAMVSIGMLAQFSSESAENDIVCRSDGTRRISEPGAGENFSCVVVFVLVYYFELAFSLWLILLTYAWSVSLQGWGKVTKAKERLEQLLPYFHIFAWTGPLVFTIGAIFINGIDGYSLSGICHISIYSRHGDTGAKPDHTLVTWFVLVPYFLTIGATLLFLAKIFFYLCHISKSTDDKATSEIRSKQARIGISIVPIVACKFISVLFTIYMVVNTGLWDDSLYKFMICKARSMEGAQCDLKNRPNILSIQLFLFCLFLPGLLTATLIDPRTTLDTWREFALKNILQKMFQAEAIGAVQEPPKQKIKKHQVVAQAYARRHEFRETGRLSLTLNSIHDDPIIALDGNPEGASASEEFSSTWAQALPRLVQRRNALVGAEQLGLKRSNSMDSNLSLSRSYSIQFGKYSWVNNDSRRHSIAGESQFSLAQSELDHLQNLYEANFSRGKRRSKTKFLGKSSFSVKKFRRSMSSRQSSFTSQEFNRSVSLASQTMPAVTLDPKKLQAAYDKTDSKVACKSEFFELEEKLRSLANASRTSKETLLTDSRNINVVSINVNNASNAATQTSLSDLSGLGKRPALKEVAVQCQISPLAIDTTTTTSSSQTEDKALLKYPIEAHVTQIRVHHEPSSGDSSSIPSSYDRDYEKNIAKKLKLLNEVEPPPGLPSFAEIKLPLSNSGLLDVRHHNRGRRGGIVDVHTAAAMLPQDDDLDPLTLDELELKARTPNITASTAISSS